MNTISSVGRVEKGWGHEEIWASTPDYCGKFMHFNSGKQFSMHFHKTKKESWYCLSGKFLIETIDTHNANIYCKDFLPGQVWLNKTLEPHRIICLQAGTIIEVSTADDPQDNYRVLPGDSQLKETT
jgi:oxalate decarboxylase/phosphoglucose isomerase-like protein (cupin superfamily)